MMFPIRIGAHAIDNFMEAGKRTLALILCRHLASNKRTGFLVHVPLGDSDLFHLNFVAAVEVLLC